jgi:hypothetical protein
MNLTIKIEPEQSEGRPFFFIANSCAGCAPDCRGVTALKNCPIIAIFSAFISRPFCLLGILIIIYRIIVSSIQNKNIHEAPIIIQLYFRVLLILINEFKPLEKKKMDRKIQIEIIKTIKFNTLFFICTTPQFNILLKK